MQTTVDSSRERFEIALNIIVQDINSSFGIELATLRIERHNVWSLLIDADAWWLEFELLSPRTFIVREIFRSVHSGEFVFRDYRSETAMVADLRVSLATLHEKMRAMPAKRLNR